MPLLRTTGMQGLHGVGKLAKARLYRGNVGRAGVVGAEIRSQELPHPSGHEVRVSRADDQPARCLGVSRADLQGHLAPIAVTANHWAVQFKGGDQRGDIVGDLPVRHFAARIGRAAVPRLSGMMTRKSSMRADSSGSQTAPEISPAWISTIGGPAPRSSQ